MSEITGQGFAKPILLSDAVNSPGWEFNSWVSGEDDLIIFTAFGREDDLGGGDLYFSRRDSLGSWTPAQNLGSPINTTALDYCPMITADGRYFFYTTAQKDYDLFFSPSLDMAGIEAIKNAPRNGLDDIYFIRVTEIPALQEVLNMSISDERADLMEQDRRFAALSAASGPAEAFRQFVHKDATLLTSQYDNVIGREAIFASMSQLPETTTLEWEPQDAGVAESGDMGWSWGRYTSLSLAEDGSEQESVGKYLNVWIRDKDGDWKVLMDLGN